MLIKGSFFPFVVNRHISASFQVYFPDRRTLKFLNTNCNPTNKKILGLMLKIVEYLLENVTILWLFKWNAILSIKLLMN